ncbi:hypothetical protein BaRGS_00005187 [Batillaria attramentaria]|uniref:Uncharacterized protein n=1 Tax=Batillaria attramentaria TaxID=370345 RepID=A0ABD0LW75_9CAEN
MINTSAAANIKRDQRSSARKRLRGLNNVTSSKDHPNDSDPPYQALTLTLLCLPPMCLKGGYPEWAQSREETATHAGTDLEERLLEEEVENHSEQKKVSAKW